MGGAVALAPGKFWNPNSSMIRLLKRELLWQFPFCFESQSSIATLLLPRHRACSVMPISLALDRLKTFKYGSTHQNRKSQPLCSAPSPAQPYRLQDLIVQTLFSAPVVLLPNPRLLLRLVRAMISS